MAFSLRDWFEEAAAQVNPFDGGKTAATVRRSRNKPAPAKTLRKPKQQTQYSTTRQSGGGQQANLSQSPDDQKRKILNQYKRGDYKWEEAYNLIRGIDDARTAQKQAKATAPQGIGENIAAATLNLAEANPVRSVGNVAGFVDTATEKTPVKGLGDWVGRNTEGLRGFGDTTGTLADRRYQNPVTREASNFFNLLGQTANYATLPAATIAGNASNTASGTIEDLRNQGFSEGAAITRGIGSGLGQAGVEFASNKITTALPFAKGIGGTAARKIGSRIAGGAINEGLEETAQQAIDNAARNKKITTGLVDSFAQGAKGGALLGGGFELANMAGMNDGDRVQAPTREEARGQLRDANPLNNSQAVQQDPIWQKENNNAQKAQDNALVSTGKEKQHFMELANLHRQRRNQRAIELSQGGFVMNPFAQDGTLKPGLDENRVFEGVDGKPRYEVDDSGARIKTKGLLKATSDGQPIALQELLDHKRLYEQYPDLRSLKVLVKGNKNQGKYEQYIDRRELGSYDSRSDTIVISGGGKSELLHEIQHAIQQREGFSRGGSTTGIEQQRDYLQRLVDALEADRAVKEYKQKTDELLDRTDITFEEKIAIADRLAGKNKTVQKWKQAYEDLSKLKYATPESAYRNLAGEAEARAVANRMNMSDGERYKQTQPMYHGTDAQFDKFDVTKAGSQKYSDWGAGIYFDVKKSGADYYRKEAVAKNDPEVNRARKNYEETLEKLGTKPMYEAIDLGLGTPEYKKAQEAWNAVVEAKDKVRSDSSRGRIIEAYLDKDAKVKNIHVAGTPDPTVGEVAKAEGYDAVRVFTGPEGDADTYLDEIVVLNPEVIKDAPQLQSTFYDSLDVPKEDLIVRDGSGKAMSVENNYKPSDADSLTTFKGKKLNDAQKETWAQFNNELDQAINELENGTPQQDSRPFEEQMLGLKNHIEFLNQRLKGLDSSHKERGLDVKLPSEKQFEESVLKERDAEATSVDPDATQDGTPQFDNYTQELADSFNSPQEMVDEMADMLYQEAKNRGTLLIDDGEQYGYGKTRVTSNDSFYRDFYKKNRKPPTKRDYQEYVESSLRTGTGMFTEQDAQAYQALLERQADTDSLLAQDQAEVREAAGVRSKGFIAKETEDGKQRVRVRARKDGSLEGVLESDNQVVSTADSLEKIMEDERKRIEQNSKNPKTKEQEVLIKDLQQKENKKLFRDLTRAYIGQEEAGQYNAEFEARDFNDKHGNLTDEQKLEVILVNDGLVEPSSDVVANAAADMRGKYNKAFDYFTKDKNINMGYRTDYSPRIYKTEDGTMVTAQDYKLLQSGSKRQKKRTQEFVEEDALVSQDPAELLNKYYKSLERAAAGKKYLQELENNGLIAKSDGSPIPGLQPIFAEGMQPENGLYYADKSVAKKLNNLFGDKRAVEIHEKILDKTSNISSAIQSMVLSGGLPGTPVNNFAIMQGVKEALGGHPIRGGKAFFRSFSPKQSTRFFEQNKDVITEMTEAGVNPRAPIAQDMGMLADYRDADTARGKFGALFHAAVDDPTFKRMLPIMHIQHYKQAKAAALKKGMSETEAAETAANSTRNWYGITDPAVDQTRNENVKRGVTATLLAPRFRESMVNFWANNVKALNPKGGFENARSVEYRDNAKFMVLSGAAFAMMSGLNEALNGVPMSDNPDDKEDKLLIPADVMEGFGIDTGGKDVAIPFLSSIATLPRNAIKGAAGLAKGELEPAGKAIGSLASIPLSNLTDLFTNEDYFGGRIYDPEDSATTKLGAQASYLVKGSNHPWIREGLNAAAGQLPEGLQDFFGVRDQSGFETASRAMEFPIRFYNPDYYRFGGEGLNKEDREKQAGTSIAEKRNYAQNKKAYEGRDKTVPIGDKTQKDGEGNFITADIYDAVTNAYNLQGKEKITKYDRDELKGAIDQVNSELESVMGEFGLSTPKLDSRTAEEWAKLSKKLRDGELNDIDAQKEIRYAVRDAYKSQLSDTQGSFYKLGDADMAEAIEAGQITQDELNQIVQIDNQLTAAGLQKYPQLGKKLRQTYGLGGAPDSGTSSSGGTRYSRPGGRSGGRSGGSRKGRLDYDLFRYGNNNPVSLSKTLRQLLNEATI